MPVDFIEEAPPDQIDFQPEAEGIDFEEEKALAKPAPKSVVQQRMVPTFGGTGAAYGGLTPEEMQDVSRHGVFQPTVQLPGLEIDPKENWKSATLKEIFNTAKSVPEFFTSPGGAMSVVAAKVSPRLTSLGFSVDLTRSAIQQAYQGLQHRKDMTPAQKAVSVVDFLATALFGLGAGAHAAGKFRIPGFQEAKPAPDVAAATAQAQATPITAPAGLVDLGGTVASEPVLPIQRLTAPVIERPTAPVIERPAAPVEAPRQTLPEPERPAQPEAPKFQPSGKGRGPYRKIGDKLIDADGNMVDAEGNIIEPKAAPVLETPPPAGDVGLPLETKKPEESAAEPVKPPPSEPGKAPVASVLGRHEFEDGTAAEVVTVPAPKSITPPEGAKGDVIYQITKEVGKPGVRTYWKPEDVERRLRKYASERGGFKESPLSQSAKSPVAEPKGTEAKTPPTGAEPVEEGKSGTVSAVPEPASQQAAKATEQPAPKAAISEANTEARVLQGDEGVPTETLPAIAPKILPPTAKVIPPNSAFIQVVDYDGRTHGYVIFPHDGTPEGINKAAKQAHDYASANYQWKDEFYNTNSRNGATDSTGKVRWVTWPGEKGKVAEVGTPEAAYMLGDIEAYAKDRAKRALDAKNVGDIEGYNKALMEQINESEVKASEHDGYAAKTEKEYAEAVAKRDAGVPVKQLDDRFSKWKDYLQHLRGHIDAQKHYAEQYRSEAARWREKLVRTVQEPSPPQAPGKAGETGQGAAGGEAKGAYTVEMSQMPAFVATVRAPDGTGKNFKTWKAAENYAAKMNKKAGKPTSQPAAAKVEPPPETPLGPGAMTKGEPKYPAAQLLTDQLRATQPFGEKESFAIRKRIADAWGKGKSAFESAHGAARAASETLVQEFRAAENPADLARRLGRIAVKQVPEPIRTTLRGVRSVTDLDRRVGELDWLLQQSAGLSRNMRKAMETQMRDKTTREAVAIWIDAGGDQTLIADALAKLPKGTSADVRRAVERAANLPPEARGFAEQVRQFYGLRLQDAQEADIFQKSLDDYYTHIWQKPENMPEKMREFYNSGRVSDYFKFARERKIPMFLDGILQGRKPLLDPAQVLPYYNYALDRAIASRKFVKELTELTASDGRPAVLPAGEFSRIEGDKGATTLVYPKAKTVLGQDYHIVDHPAMKKWKWMGTDEAGNTVMMQSTLGVHPEFYTRIRRMLDQRLATPSPAAKLALRVSGEIKAVKLAALPSMFHQIHVGSHALFHWTLPFKTAEIDWTSPAARFAVEKGHLRLAADEGAVGRLSEDLMPHGLIHKVPLVGTWSKMYSEWLFGDYIPRLKLKTFENAYARNLWARDNLPAKVTGLKGLTDEQIAARIGDSVNNAYGELNHWFLGKFGRSPVFQRVLRGLFLAPDFGEARLRFVEKTATKAGFEERLAMATMIGTMYFAARAANWLSHGDPETDFKNAFRVKARIPGSDKWEWVTMRSVAGDLVHALDRFGQFMYVRLNPIYTRTAMDMIFGRDVYGRKLSLSDKLLKRPAEQLVPINFSGLTREDGKLWESAVTSMGFQFMHDVPAMDIGNAKRKWMLRSGDPKLVTMAQRQEQELFPPSDYGKLRRELLNNDLGTAKEEYNALVKEKGKKPTDIIEALRPVTGGRVVNGRYMPARVKPIGGQIGQVNEIKFLRTLKPSERKLYEQAARERQLIYQRFTEMLRTKKEKD